MGASIRLPKLDQDMVEGHVLEWLVEDGAEVQEGDPVVVIETDKVATELVAEGSGIVRIVVHAGQSAPVGGELGTIGGDAGRAASPQTGSDGAAAATTGKPEVSPAAAPCVPPGAATLRLPLDRNSWQRPHALSPRRRAALGGDGAMTGVGVAAETVATSVTTVSQPTPTQRALIETVTRSWAVPQFASRTLVPAAAIVNLVQAFRDRDGGRISVTHVLLKLMAGACREEPALNAHYVDGRRLRLDSLDINVLVEAGDDLYNPCVSGVAEKPLVRIADETRALIERARGHALTREDLRPGSMTLSNLGMYDIDDFTPLLYPPQVGILGVGRVNESVAFVATLVVDHRAVNGAQAARWLARFKGLCADPARLL